MNKKYQIRNEEVGRRRKTEVGRPKSEKVCPRIELLKAPLRLSRIIGRGLGASSIAVGFSQRKTEANSSFGLQPHNIKMWLKPIFLFNSRQLKLATKDRYAMNLSAFFYSPEVSGQAAGSLLSIAVGFSQRNSENNLKTGLQPYKMWLKPFAQINTDIRQLKQTAIKMNSTVFHKLQSRIVSPFGEIPEGKGANKLTISFLKSIQFTANEQGWEACTLCSSTNPPAGGGWGVEELAIRACW